MIGAVRGVLDAVGPDWVIVETPGGVGYLIHVGTRTLAAAPAFGGEMRLRVETVVREDSIKLYGFRSEAERAWFRRLMGVSGVSAKLAAALLDVFDPPVLDQIVAAGDAKALARAKGVGPKLAQRVVNDLSGGKPEEVARTAGGEAGVSAMGASPGQGGSTEQSAILDAPAGANLRIDAVAALVTLGFPESDAHRAVARHAADAGELDALIRAALKELSS